MVCCNGPCQDEEERRSTKSDKIETGHPTARMILQAGYSFVFTFSSGVLIQVLWNEVTYVLIGIRVKSSYIIADIEKSPQLQINTYQSAPLIKSVLTKQLFWN